MQACYLVRRGANGVHLVRLVAAVVALHGGEGRGQRGVVVVRHDKVAPVLLLVIRRRDRVLLVVGLLGEDRWL